MKSTLLVLLALALSATPVGAQQLDLTLRPEVASGALKDWHVIETIDSISGSTRLVLSIPTSLGPLQHIADRIEQVHARDAAGELALDVSDGSGMMGPSRLYRATRPVQGRVTLDYDVVPSQETISGPNWELRTEGLGSSAQGSSVLLLPDAEGAYKAAIHWDLAQLPQGASAIDSFDRDPSLEKAPVMRLRQTYLMAGPLTVLPYDVASKGAFRGASMAKGNYDQAALLAWSAEAFQRMSAYFGFEKEPPFTVMMRSNIYGGVSGTAGPEGLIATMSKQASARSVKSLIAHEMVHVYLNGLFNADDNGENLDASWFTEGIAVFFQSQAPHATGLFTDDEYLEDVNEVARSYYSNIRIHVPMAETTKNFWTDPRERIQPYDRGAMYFYKLEGEIRVHSNDKRGVIDLIQSFLSRKAQGLSVTDKDWANLVEQELGPQSRADFEAMMAGAVQVPSSEALGPCYERVAETMPSFELGFDMSSLIKRPRVITGLDPQSPAARAGLLNGDVVTNTLIIDAIQADPRKAITLLIKRGDQTQSVRFAPSGRSVQGYQWMLSGKPACQTAK